MPSIRYSKMSILCFISTVVNSLLTQTRQKIYYKTYSCVYGKREMISIFIPLSTHIFIDLSKTNASTIYALKENHFYLWMKPRITPD